MGFLAAAIGAGASLVGGLIGNRSARKEAQRNRNFQEEMSNTAVSRRMQDLQSVGLNPLLATSSAQAGASTPVGSMASQQNVFDPAAYAAFTNAWAVKQQVQMQKQQNKADLELKKKELEVQNVRMNQMQADIGYTTARQQETMNVVNRDQLIRDSMQLSNMLLQENVLSERGLQRLRSAQTQEAASRILVNEMQRSKLGSDIVVNIKESGRLQEVTNSLRLANREFEATTQARVNEAYLNSAMSAQEYKYNKERLKMNRNKADYVNTRDVADDSLRISRNIIDLLPVPFVQRSAGGYTPTSTELAPRR